MPRQLYCSCCTLLLRAAGHFSLRGATWKRQVDGENQGENEDLDRHGKCFRGSCLFVTLFVCVCESGSSFRALINALCVLISKF